MSDQTDMEAPGAEGVLEHDLPICDAHHHLWEYPGNVYLGKDLMEDVDGHNVVQTVSYNVHWNAAKRLTRELSPAERHSLFYATAAQAYRLQSHYN